MRPPFHFTNNDIIGLMDYRIECCAADEEGSVICDGEILHVNRYGVMKQEPDIINLWFEKTTTILSLQSGKRKRERDLGRPAP